MRLITILDRDFNEILIDMDLKRPEVPPAKYFRRWMAATMPRWGIPVLVISAIITTVSIVTMLAKWL